MSCFCTSQNGFSDAANLQIQQKYILHKVLSRTYTYGFYIDQRTHEGITNSNRYTPVITTPNDLIIFKVLTNSYPEYIMEVRDRSKLFQSKENSACPYSPCHLILSGNQMIQLDMTPTWCFRQAQKQNQVHKAHGGAQEG